MSNPCDFIKIYNVEDPQNIKYQLLDLIQIQLISYDIQQLDYRPSASGGGNPYTSDFYISNSRRGDKYNNFITKLVTPFIEDYCRDFGCKIYSDFTEQWWFQQYTLGERFNWHDHSSGAKPSSISCIYYAELSDPSEATQFFRYSDLNLTEGSFVVFPSFLPHRSPKIKSQHRKTIFACNINLTLDKKYVNEIYEDR